MGAHTRLENGMDGLQLVPSTAPVLTPAEVKERIRAERIARLGKPLEKQATRSIGHFLLAKFHD
jgi:hypothetical protein